MQPEAFDTYAADYDTHFTHSLIGRAQRARVHKFLGLHLKENAPALLELNCGTGEDAAYLYQQGAAVTASDISGEMIRVAQQKNQGKNIVFVQSPMQELHRQIPPASYDVVFSNFGGLNCLAEHELRRLSADCRTWLRPGGRLVFVVMGRNCRWERFFFGRRGEKEKASRRRRTDGVPTTINEQHFLTWYYSPAELSAIFGDHFSTTFVRPVGLFVPPSYLEAWVRKRRLVFGVLQWLEKLFGNMARLSDAADHYFIVMQSKSPDTAA